MPPIANPSVRCGSRAESPAGSSRPYACRWKTPSPARKICTTPATRKSSKSHRYPAPAPRRSALPDVLAAWPTMIWFSVMSLDAFPPTVSIWSETLGRPVSARYPAAGRTGVRLAASRGCGQPPSQQVSVGVTLCVCGLSACFSRSSAVARWSRGHGSSWPPGTWTRPASCWPARRRSMSPGSSALFRGPGRRVAFWLLAGGALFAVGVCLGDAITDLPTVADSSLAWLVLLIGECASNLAAVTSIGLIGLFPTGVPQSRGERAVLSATAVAAVLIPVALMASSQTPPAGLVPAGGAGHRQPAVHFGAWPGGAGPGRAAVHFFRVDLPRAGPAVPAVPAVGGGGPPPDPLDAGRHGERAARLRREQRCGDFQLGNGRDGSRLGALGARAAAGVRIAGGGAVRRRSRRHRPRRPPVGHLPDAVADDRRGLRRGGRRARHPRQPVPDGRRRDAAGRRRRPGVPAGAAQAGTAGRPVGVREAARRLRGDHPVRRAARDVARRGGPAAPARRRDTPGARPGVGARAPRRRDRDRRARSRHDRCPGLRGAAGSRGQHARPDRVRPAARRPAARRGPPPAGAPGRPGRDGREQPAADRGTDRLPGQDRARPGRRAAAHPAGPARRRPAGRRGADGQAGAGAGTAAPRRPAHRRAPGRAPAGPRRPARHLAGVRARDPSAGPLRPGAARGDRGTGRQAAARGGDRGRPGAARRPLPRAHRDDHLVRGGGGADQRGQARAGGTGARRAHAAGRAPDRRGARRRLRLRSAGRRADSGWPASPTGSRSCTGRCASTASQGGEPRCTPRSRFPRRAPSMAEPRP